MRVVQGSTLPARNRVLLGDDLRGILTTLRPDRALDRRLAALHNNGDDYTRAKTELIQELTGKARGDPGFSRRRRWGGVVSVGKSERCGRQRSLRR